MRPLEWRGSIPSCLHFSQECGHTPPMQIYGRTTDPSSFCAHCSLHVCSKRSRLDWRLSGEKNRNCDQATHFLLLVSIPIALPKFLCSFCQYVMSSSFGFSMGCPLTRVNCPIHYSKDTPIFLGYILPHFDKKCPSKDVCRKISHFLLC